MSGSTKRAKPADPVNADVESYCWHENGWECAPEFSVRDARKVTRGKAAAAFSREVGGDLRWVRVWKRYVRPLTRQDVWDDYGREPWAWRRDMEYDEAPALPPDDWQPDWEEVPVWTFVHRSHPNAIPVWICAEKGSSVPENPRPRATA